MHAMSLDLLHHLLRHAWGADTAAPGITWSPLNPTAGQCAITAALVWDLCGLPVVRGWAHLPSGPVSHYWNDGVDLTAGQFPLDTSFSLQEGPQGEAAYAYLLSKPETLVRYHRLKTRVLS
jgi:hypothetical protein